MNQKRIAWLSQRLDSSVQNSSASAFVAFQMSFTMEGR